MNIQLVHTPGHSDDGVSLVLEGGTAIVGDLCVNTWPIFWGRYIPPFINSFEELLASWRKLLDMGIAEVFLGHGKPFPAKKLAALLKRRSR